MADEAKKDSEAKEKPKGGKKKLVIGGGAAGVLALAFAVALMAVPKKEVEPVFGGPFVAPMFTEQLRVNLSGENNKRFAVLSLNVVYDAYDEAYYNARTLDAMYAAQLKDAVLGIASTKEREEIVDKAHKPVFLEEVKQAVEPLLFPVYLGESKKGEGGPPLEADKQSGLALGETPPTFRGRYHDHVVKVDAVAKKIQLDDGPEVTFAGDESELELSAADGSKLFLDLTALAEDFQGQVQVGVKGRMLEVLWAEVLIQ